MINLAVATLAIGALYVGREIFVPVALAVLLSFVLAPFATKLQQWKLPRTLSVFVVVFLGFSVIFSLGGLMVSQATRLADDLPSYQQTLKDKIESIRGLTGGSGTLERASNVLKELKTELQNSEAGGPPSAGNLLRQPGEKPIPVEVKQPDPGALTTLVAIIAPLLSPLTTTGIVVIFVVFILLQRQDLRNRFVRLAGSQDIQRTTAALDEAGKRLSKLFLTQIAFNAIFGLVIGVGLELIGVPSAPLWGLIAMIMRFVPYIGALISAVFPLILAAAVGTGWEMLALTAALFAGLELLAGQVIEPLVYGHSTGLSPVAIIVSASFWTWLWGPVGLILSMPLTLCLVVLGRHVDRLEFLDVLLGDRPALTPVESFYHRMLAGDVDEVQDYAEQLLDDRPLSSYYDEVAIPGLQLAAVDVERGVLTENQIVGITDGVEYLLGELSDHDDSNPSLHTAGNRPAGPSRDQQALTKQLTPESPETSAQEALSPAWCAPSAVLCVAGRGPLDGAASAMLAQLLGKHGLGARVVPHAAIGSRAALASFDLAGVMMVCLTYASIGGTPSHLRYAVRRLRSRLPGAPILVGLWPAEVLEDGRLRAAIGADRYAASLREAVIACLEQARTTTDQAAAATVG